MSIFQNQITALCDNRLKELNSRINEIDIELTNIRTEYKEVEDTRNKLLGASREISVTKSVPNKKKGIRKDMLPNIVRVLSQIKIACASDIAHPLYKLYDVKTAKQKTSFMRSLTAMLYLYSKENGKTNPLERVILNNIWHYSLRNK